MLLARDAPRAVVLRRGPSHHVCTIGWDRRDDTFELGQWYRGRIYFEKCDLSPDGVHWVYFALNGKRHEPTLGAYTVLARAPYLKALGLWPVGDTWGGGGLFGTRGDYWPFHTEPMISPPAEPTLSSDFLRDAWHRGSIHVSRLLRDGWSSVAEPDRGAERYVHVLERPVHPSWVLRRECEVRSEGFELINRHDGRVVGLPEWEWADLDRGRVVWASRGCLWAAGLDSTGLVDARLLGDFNDMTFHRTRAPY